MATKQPTASDTARLANVICTVMPMVVDHVSHRLEDFGMTRNDYWALQCIDGPTPMKSLATSMNIDPSYVTLIADKLEELGLIERHLHPSDRRVKNLVTTPDGERLLKLIPNLLWDGQSPFSGLSAAEQSQISVLLTKVIDNAVHSTE